MTGMVDARFRVPFAFLAAVLLAAAILLLTAAGAHADAAHVGDNLGKLGQSQLKWPFYCLAGVVMLAACLSKKLGLIVVTFLAIVVVGIVVLQPNKIGTISKSVGNEATK